MSNSPRVLVAQENDFDYTPAAVFGAVEFVTSGDWSVFANSLRNKKIASDTKQAFTNYVAGYDYIVLTGSPLNMAVVIAEMMKHGKRHRLLKWCNRTFSYAPTVMEFP